MFDAGDASAVVTGSLPRLEQSGRAWVCEINGPDSQTRNVISDAAPRDLFLIAVLAPAPLEFDGD